MSKYHSDQPIYENSNDQFNRGTFVDDFTHILSNFENNENYIIGLFAKWGYGKTSTVNLILEKLKAKKEFCAIYVSTWALGGDSDKIIWDILEQTSLKLTNKSIKTKTSKTGEILNKVSKAELPFGLETEFDLFGSEQNETIIKSGKIMGTVGFVSQLLTSSDNIAKARKRIEKSINGEKVVVFLDDLDRLDGKQILEILRAINTVADYGGMTYVLPFDKRYVCSAIEETLPKGRSGDEFIEKIIQVPLNLPLLTQKKIDQVFLGKLEQILSEFNIFMNQEEIDRFQKLYFFGANNYITSPRDINKLINALKFRIPIAINEVNITDTIITEIIRVFDEPLYDLIKTNREILVKQTNNLSQRYLMDQDNKQRKSDADKIISELNELQIEMLQNLFPIIDTLYSNYGLIDANTLRKEQRIASEYYFDLYFSSLDEELGISNRKIIDMLQLSKYPEKLRKKMKHLINHNNFDIAVKYIMDRAESINNKLEFCKAMLDLIEDFPRKYESSGFSLSIFNITIFNIDILLKDSHTKLDDYISLLYYTYDKNRIDSIPLLIREIVLYANKRNKGIEIDLTEEEVKLYKEHALTIIRKLAKHNKIPINTINHETLIYHYWADFGDKSECSDYITKHTKTAEQVIDFLSQFIEKWSESGKNIYHRGDFKESTYKEISRYIDPSYFYNLLISNETYKILTNVKQDDLISFEDPYDSKYGRKSNFTKVGNEHTDEFRNIVARRFMYFYENDAHLS